MFTIEVHQSLKKIIYFFSFTFLLILSHACIDAGSLAQQYKFAWITDIHIGSPNADTDLNSVVNNINTNSEIQFVIASGDITEKGKNSELVEAKFILDKLKIPYYIVPGNHDTKWSESGTTKFSQLWKDDKFVFEIFGTKFIGLNSGVPWRGGGGHFAPEDLVWLDSIVTNTIPNQEIFFVTHHQPDGEIDNWFLLTNILRKKNIQQIFVGHGHSNRVYNFNGISGVMSRSTLSKGKVWGYNLVQNRRDSIFFFEVNADTTKLWHASKISKQVADSIKNIDSTQYIDDDKFVVWKTELKSTLSSSLVFYRDKLIVPLKNGTIYCFDVDGNLLWKQSVHSTIMSKPAAEADILAVATIEGDIHTFNISTGKLIQVIGIAEPITSQLVTYKTDYLGEKTFALIFGTATGKLFSYDLFMLNPIWERQISNAMIEAKPLIVKDRIVVGSWDYYLYCIDAKNGNLNWKWTENKNFYYSPAACSPVTDGENVFISTPDKFVSSIDVLLGKTNWRKNDFASWESIGLSDDKKTIFVKSFSNKFYKADAKSGKVISEIDLKFGVDTMPIEIFEMNGKIFFGAKNGWVYSIDEQNNFKKIFFLGTSRIHSLLKISESRLAASNMDGTIAVFRVK